MTTIANLLHFATNYSPTTLGQFQELARPYALYGERCNETEWLYLLKDGSTIRVTEQEDKTLRASLGPAQAMKKQETNQ